MASHSEIAVIESHSEITVVGSSTTSDSEPEATPVVSLLDRLKSLTLAGKKKCYVNHPKVKRGLLAVMG